MNNTLRERENDEKSIEYDRFDRETDGDVLIKPSLDQKSIEYDRYYIEIGNEGGRRPSQAG
jgi:hypothetical protein